MKSKFPKKFIRLLSIRFPYVQWLKLLRFQFLIPLKYISYILTSRFTHGITTWPCLNELGPESCSSTMCGACEKGKATTMLQMFGQPYNSNTLATLPPKPEAMLNRVSEQQIKERLIVRSTWNLRPELACLPRPRLTLWSLPPAPPQILFIR